MEQFSLINFLTISIPEEFLLSFFIWTILGKKDTVKFRYVIFATLFTSIAFVCTNILSNSNATIYVIFNLIILTLTVLLLYNLSFIEAILAALLSFVLFTIVQAVVANLGLMIADYTLDEIEKNYTLKLIISIPSSVIFGMTALILYKLNVKVLNFKKKNMSVYYFSRVRFVVLQLSFTFLIIIFNFKLYWSNKSLFNSFSDTVLIIMNMSFVVLLTIVIVINVFKMGRNIQKEEELKRKYDNREVFQNIDYLCKLMESKDYDEANNILISMKNDVNSDIINK